jgi:hypothetical protein
LIGTRAAVHVPADRILTDAVAVACARPSVHRGVGKIAAATVDGEILVRTTLDDGPKIGKLIERRIRI